jgi:signal peptidase I
MHRGVVSVNGTPVKEPYLNPIQDLRDYGPITVPADNLFVMGDNRTNSLDSRFALGMIPYDKVIGRAFAIIWPPSRVGWLRRP